MVHADQQWNHAGCHYTRSRSDARHPVFRGTRIPVQTLFDDLENGESLDEFPEGFPTINRELAIQVLEECKELRWARVSRSIRQTAAYARLAGLENGVLLAAAEAAAFEVLIPTDREIPYRQNLDGLKISILILCAPTNRLEDSQRLVPEALLGINSIQPGQVIRLNLASPRDLVSAKKRRNLHRKCSQSLAQGNARITPDLYRMARGEVCGSKAGSVPGHFGLSRKKEAAGAARRIPPFQRAHD